MDALCSSSQSRRLSSWSSPDERKRAKEIWLASLDVSEGAWIFGYGSLLWNPEFEYEEVRPATLFGFHRRFCVYSHIYRGTPARPGLVLGLDAGGSCRGRVFRIAPKLARQVLGQVWDREMVYRVYLPRTLIAHSGAERLRCRTFVANPAHEQYAGTLDAETAAELIARATGKSGSNREYLDNTIRHLDELGLRDGALHALQRLVHRQAGNA